ncbi:MAG TPA: DUF2089 domain-containing protein [Anaerolineae bacterium]|nr:DUF2089 domain-containing protein [Anaerolineae bacterium]
METVKFEVGETPVVKIKTIGGDLRLSGRRDTQFEAQAPEQGTLTVDQDDDRITVSCRSGCLIFLPAAARVEVEQVGGDARVIGFTNELMMKTVGGDLSLRRVARSTFELIGGDLHARKVDGDLTVDRIGGDAIAEKVEGDVRLRSVGADLVLHNVTGLVEATVGGDASLSLSPKADASSVVIAGGDLSCRLPEDVSVQITMKAGGDMAMPSEVERVSENGATVIRLGDAETAIELTAGGDLWLRVGKMEMDFAEDFVGSVMGELDARLAEMEARFNAIGAGMYTFDAERIGERVRHSVERARRRATKAQERAAKRAEKYAHKYGRRHSITIGGPEPREPLVSDEERLTILRMLEQGTISVEEAEKLLKTLGGED